MSERTEQPTQRRREDARRRGQVALSRELDSAIVLFAAFIALKMSGARMWSGMQALLRDSFTALDGDPLTTDLAAALGPELVWRAITLLAPLALAVVVVGTAGGVLQTGGIFSLQVLQPKASRMNPWQGLKRMAFSKQTLVTLAKTLAKFLVIGGVAAMTLRAHMPALTALGLEASIPDALGTLVGIASDIVLKVLGALVAVAAADYLFQRRSWISELRMTRQEVIDEHRQQEGDPQVKSRIARLRRAFLTRIMQAVPHADVVLMNPTHYAVALKYDPVTGGAPRVIAKGERLIALRIRELAIEHGIPVITNPPLARAIYRAVPVGREIPPELYEAVAEVLAFVYRLRFPRARAVAA